MLIILVQCFLFGFDLCQTCLFIISIKKKKGQVAVRPFFRPPLFLGENHIDLATQPWGIFCATSFWKIRPSDISDLETPSRIVQQRVVSVYYKKYISRCGISS